ncbi:MAG: hypothetical protein JO334_12315 [Verrucomicrobia bacterium]|nr:hypothetical protein [Verrucomicrobiota bacterium]
MIDQARVVDLVAISDKEREVTFEIIDHFSWRQDELWHLQLLQDKLNYYLDVLDSGDVYNKVPKAKIYKVIIEITGLYPLSKAAEEFLAKAKNVIETLGFELKFRLSPNAKTD